MDIKKLRSDAFITAGALTEAVLRQEIDVADIMNLVKPPTKITRPEMGVWQELLVQSIQRQLRGYNVTV
ncbi:hypothetical protein [Bradyrhizobium sp. USDA 4504]